MADRGTIRAKIAKGVFVAYLATFGLASAGTPLKWRTLDGVLYFGESPPAGSVAIGPVDGRGLSVMESEPDETLVPARLHEAPGPAPRPFVNHFRSGRNADELLREVLTPQLSPRGQSVDFVGETATVPRGNWRELTFCVKNFTPQRRQVTVRLGDAASRLGMVAARSVECATMKVDTAEANPERLRIVERRG